MTAPVFILSHETIEPAGGAAGAGPGDLLILTGPEARHAVSVRRLRAGERADLVDGAGLRLVCEVAPGGGARDRLEVRVMQRVEEPAAALRLVLVQALAKGDRDTQAVETATEVGVAEVLPWQAERCVSVWKGAKAERGRERWQATAREAAKQARRAWVPKVAGLHRTKELEAWTRRTTADGGIVLVLHEEASVPISGVPIPAPGDSRALAVVVGPEGGISEAEVAALEVAGASVVRLGPHVMRTSTAGPVALAVLAQRAGLWG